MAKKLFYAVKTGRIPGIYKSWDDCKKQTDGFPGSIYKGFATKSDAEEFLELGNEKDKLTELLIDNKTIENTIIADAVAYVDGSYEDSQKEFSYGLVIFYDGIENHFCEKYNTPSLVGMRNVAGEIMGAQKAMQFCVNNNIKSLDLYYDYEGIEKWCTGVWKANKTGTKDYKNFYDRIKTSLKVNFYKVAAHTGDTYNELADQLAKSALSGVVLPPNIDNIKEKAEMATFKSIYLEREKIDEILPAIGKSEWVDFNMQPLCNIHGNQYRCNFVVDTKSAMLDFYFNNGGTTTIKPTGTNLELSKRLAELISQHGYKNEHKNSSCTFKMINDEYFDQLIIYLKSINKIDVVEESAIETPAHKHFKFRSSFGDSIVINKYNTGKLLFQGNPAYLFTEALYFMSLSPDVSLDEIIEKKNETYNTKITVDMARSELKRRIPNAYDKLDETILKVLSPSISQSLSAIETEDYSCYVFPAFKALDTLLLSTLCNKGVVVDPTKNNYGSVFTYDDTVGKHVLAQKNKNIINNSDCIDYLEAVYNYFKGNRNVIFHGNSILCLVKIIEIKTEADALLNQILAYIDEAGIKVL